MFLPSSYLQVLAIIFGSLSFLTAGIQYAWTSPFIPILTSTDFPDANISFEDASYFTVIPPIAAIIFCPIFSKMADIIGRKYVLLLSAPVHLGAYVLIYFGKSVAPFYISRFLSGFADAIIWSTLPIYVGEISTPNIRGSWGNLPTIAVYLGQLYINIMGSYVNYYTCTIVLAVIPVVFFITFIFMPESPYYLLSVKKKEEAYTAFLKLHQGNHEDMNIKFNELKTNVKKQLSEKSSFKELFTLKSNRRALIIVMGARAASQLSGIAAFTVYTQYLFEKSGQNLSKELSSIIFNAVLLTLAVLSAFYQDKFGRKTAMIISSFSCGLVLLFEAIYFFLDQETSVDVSFFSWIPLTGMIIYLLCFTIGLSLVPTLLMGEVFSSSVKANAIIVSNIWFNGLISVTTKIFQALTYNFGLYIPFLVFSLCCFVSAIFSYWFLLETQGKTLEEIQKTLKIEDKKLNKIEN